jgi:hypothetical protein
VCGSLGRLRDSSEVFGGFVFFAPEDCGKVAFFTTAFKRDLLPKPPPIQDPGPPATFKSPPLTKDSEPLAVLLAPPLTQEKLPLAFLRPPLTEEK